MKNLPLADIRKVATCLLLHLFPRSLFNLLLTAEAAKSKYIILLGKDILGNLMLWPGRCARHPLIHFRSSPQYFLFVIENTALITRFVDKFRTKNNRSIRIVFLIKIKKNVITCHYALNDSSEMYTPMSISRRKYI